MNNETYTVKKKGTAGKVIGGVIAGMIAIIAVASSTCSVPAGHTGVIVTLGNFATRFILKTDRGITSLRGRAYTAGKFYVLPTFHPAAAIYDKSKCELMESDFRLLNELLRVERERKAERLAAQGGAQ